MLYLVMVTDRKTGKDEAIYEDGFISPSWCTAPLLEEQQARKIAKIYNGHVVSDKDAFPEDWPDYDD